MSLVLFLSFCSFPFHVTLVVVVVVVAVVVIIVVMFRLLSVIAQCTSKTFQWTLLQVGNTSFLNLVIFMVNDGL